MTTYSEAFANVAAMNALQAVLTDIIEKQAKTNQDLEAEVAARDWSEVSHYDKVGLGLRMAETVVRDHLSQARRNLKAAEAGSQ
jgi:hypothetical protein